MIEKALEVSRDNINRDLTRIMRGWTDGSKHVIAHYLSPIEFRRNTAFTGTDHELIDWVKDFPYKVGAIYVVSDHSIVYDMEKIRPELVFYPLVVRDDNTNTEKQIVGSIRSVA